MNKDIINKCDQGKCSISDFINGTLFKKYDITDINNTNSNYSNEMRYDRQTTNREYENNIGMNKKNAVDGIELQKSRLEEKELKKRRGIQCHEYIENMLKNILVNNLEDFDLVKKYQEFSKKYPDIVNNYPDIVDNYPYIVINYEVLVKDYPDLNIKDFVYIKSSVDSFIKEENYIIISIESSISDETLQLNGKFDILLYNAESNTYFLVDWKSSMSEYINNYNGISESTKLIRDSSYNRYSIQLLLYKYILQKNYRLSNDIISISSNNSNSNLIINNNVEFASRKPGYDPSSMGSAFRRSSFASQNLGARPFNINMILFCLNLDNQEKGPRINLIQNNSRLIDDIVKERLRKNEQTRIPISYNAPISKTVPLVENNIPYTILEKLKQIYKYVTSEQYLKIETHFEYIPNNFAKNKMTPSTFENNLVSKNIVTKQEFDIKFTGLSYLSYNSRKLQSYNKILVQYKVMSEETFKNNYMGAIRKLEDTNDENIVIQVYRDNNQNIQKTLYEYLKDLNINDNKNKIVILFNRIYFIDTKQRIYSIDRTTESFYEIPSSNKFDQVKTQSKCTQCYNISTNIENKNDGKYFCDRQCQLIYYLNKRD